MNLPVSPYFAADYRSARDRFLAAARERGAALQSHVHPDHLGAQGEQLAMDVAYVGDASADSLIVVTSGVHGVEGFCGSGCQVALLHDDAFMARREQHGVAMLFIHAVNPWGFSHLRRVNEDNIDLNRNFIDHTASIVADPAFAQLHPLLVPAQWPPAPQDVAALDAFIAERGTRGFQQVLMRGQRTHADSLFHAGRAPAWSNTTLRRVLAEHGATRRQLAWIDLHTGLGPAGVGEKLYVGDNDPAELARARATWGADLIDIRAGGSVSEEVQGPASTCLGPACPGVAVQRMALEYGTVPFMGIVQAMRADQWLVNRRGDVAPDQHREIKQALRDAFYIDSDEWRAAVVAQARAGALSAVLSLSATCRTTAA
jgi:hypothetical protein